MTVQDRIERLEQQNRLMRIGLVLVFLISVCGAGVAAMARTVRASEPPEPTPGRTDESTPKLLDIIQAKELHVVDESGATVVRLYSGPDGGGFIDVGDPEGYAGVFLSADKSGARLSVWPPWVRLLTSGGKGGSFGRGRDAL